MFLLESTTTGGKVIQPYFIVDIHSPCVYSLLNSLNAREKKPTVSNSTFGQSNVLAAMKEVYMYIYIYVNIHIYVYINILTFIQIHIYMYMYIYIYIHTYVHVYVYIYIYIHMYIYMFCYLFLVLIFCTDKWINDLKQPMQSIYMISYISDLFIYMLCIGRFRSFIRFLACPYGILFTITLIVIY
jgi:hypothetical protein